MSSIDLPRLGVDTRRHESVPMRALWSLWNTLQLAFTLLWTAACITLAMALRAITGRREGALRMAAWLWAPGLLGGRFVARGAGQAALGFLEPLLRDHAGGDIAREAEGAHDAAGGIA